VARIRTIKPSFFTSHDIAALSLTARLTYIGLWTYVDDAGRGLDDARLIKGALWSLDDRHTVKKVEADLRLLADRGHIERYAVDERSYLRIVEWNHQRINRPTPSILPAPLPASAVSSHAPLTEDSPQEGKGREGNREKPPPPTSAEPPAEIDRGGDIEAVLTEAARLLAELEADRRGNEIGNRAGYIRARVSAIRAEHEPTWRAILDAEPGATARQLADGRPAELEADRAVHAMRSRIERTDRRKRGETCPDCDDLGVVDVGDGTFDDCDCKTRRSA
jgi:hypothetical protein